MTRWTTLALLGLMLGLVLACEPTVKTDYDEIGYDQYLPAATFAIEREDRIKALLDRKQIPGLYEGAPLRTVRVPPDALETARSLIQRDARHLDYWVQIPKD